MSSGGVLAFDINDGGKVALLESECYRHGVGKNLASVDITPLAVKLANYCFHIASPFVGRLLSALSSVVNSHVLLPSCR